VEGRLLPTPGRAGRASPSAMARDGWFDWRAIRGREQGLPTPAALSARLARRRCDASTLSGDKTFIHKWAGGINCLVGTAPPPPPPPPSPPPPPMLTSNTTISCCRRHRQTHPTPPTQS
jgi:hypothetical protein